MLPLELGGKWVVPAADLQVRFVRSSGPGGQNVNKVATKVELRLLLEATAALSVPHKHRLREAHPSYCNAAGHLVITADTTRSQADNLEAARGRLKAMILSTRHPPKARRATKPTKGSQRRRIEGKKQRSAIKKQRGRVDW